jgi:hypothetical protein
MRKKLLSVVAVLAVGVTGLVLVASAAGTSAREANGIRPHGVVVALALDGNRLAYALVNKVSVWDLETGKQMRVSGEQTGAANGVTGGGVTELAIAGSRVAWLIQSTSNEESDVDLYTSSLLSPKERHVVGEVRSGNQCGAGRGGYQPACAGTWLGGVVGSGNRILVNRWTTDTTGAITEGGLFALKGTKLSPIASGAGMVAAAAADPNRVAVVQWRWHPPGKDVHVYTFSGRRLFNVMPKKQPLGVALNSRNLVVLQRYGQLTVYNARTGALRRTFNLPGRSSFGTSVLGAFASYGNIAVYSLPLRYRDYSPSESAIHALNLTTGKDRVIGRSPGQITLAQIDSVGLVYATQGDGYAHNSVVFVPLGRVAAAVS